MKDFGDALRRYESLAESRRRRDLNNKFSKLVKNYYQFFKFEYISDNSGLYSLTNNSTLDLVKKPFKF